MANNPDFMKLVIKNVDLQWPRLDQPYRYNQATEKTEPCAPTAQNAAWSCGWTVPMAEGKAMFEVLKKHFNECKARNPSLGVFSKVFGMKKDEASGTVTFSAKRACVSQDGSVKKPPTVTDARLQDLADKAIWSGSKGGLRVLAFPTKDPRDGAHGITLLLDAVVVSNPVYGGNGLADDFGIDDSIAGDFDAPPAPAKVAAPAPAAESAEADF